MTFDEYRLLASRTSDPSRGQLVNTLYAAVGLAGEWAEWTQDQTIEEAGDVCWHLAEISRVWGFGCVEPEPGPLGPMPIRALGIIAEASKKWACHGRSRSEFAGDVIASVAHLLWIIGIDHHLPDVYAHNIAKLRERHPDGFDPSYHDARGVLAGYEWDSFGSLWAPGMDRDGGEHIAHASVHNGQWWVYSAPSSGTVIANGISDDPKRAAESALRAYLEANQ